MSGQTVYSSLLFDETNLGPAPQHRPHGDSPLLLRLAHPEYRSRQGTLRREADQNGFNSSRWDPKPGLPKASLSESLSELNNRHTVPPCLQTRCLYFLVPLVPADLGMSFPLTLFLILLAPGFPRVTIFKDVVSLITSSFCADLEPMMSLLA